MRTLATTFIFFSSVTALVAQVSGKEQQELLARFSAWQQAQIAQHVYWAADSCNMQWFADHESTGEAYGFPDDEDLFFSYGDLNADGKSELLVTFNPVQCDGGNGSMWVQECVLFVSGENGYTTVSGNILPHRIAPENGFYHYTGISGNGVTAMHYVFGEDDAHCCPSEQVPVTFDYATGRIVKRGRNKFTDPNAAPEYYLGEVVSDSASVVPRTYRWMPDLPGILQTANRMEIRLTAGNGFGGGNTTVIAYDQQWKATHYSYDRRTNVSSVKDVTGDTDFRAFFAQLVDNHVFSLPDCKTLNTDVLVYHPETNEMTGEGRGVADGTTYVLEFKIGKECRSYVYHQPDAFADYIDEFRYFANIVDLFDAAFVNLTNK